MSAGESTAGTSVVVPVFRVAGHVQACLDSIVGQTRPPAEIVLVDDRGGDESMDLARRRLDRADVPWRVVRHARNLGVGAARNSGLAASVGDRIWFVDSDDRADPRFLELMSAAMDRTGAAVAACRTARCRPGGPILAIDEPAVRGAQVTGAQFAKGLLHNRFRAYAGSKLFRRDVLPVAPFDVGRVYEDFRPMLRVALRAPHVALLDEPLYHYTINPDSLSARFAPHTVDLFVVGDDVRAELAGVGLDRRWRHDLAVYETVNVVMPVANLAIRARAVGADDAVTAAAIRSARGRLTVRTLGSLVRYRRWRRLAAMSALKLCPAVYERRLAATPTP